MRIAGLFAGIGGFEVGFGAAGHETVLTCENWRPAMAVLKARLPDVPNHDDVRSLKDLPAEADLLCGGFPCQDLSQAGKTAGIGGERSGLVDQIFRLLDARRVPWVVLENVSFMLQLEQGRALDRLAHEFEERGYRWAYRVVSAQSFLPQRRERVFFVASTVADPADVVLVDDVEPQIPSTDLAARAHGFYWTEGIRGLGWAVDAVPTLKNGSTVGIASPPAILLPDGSVIKPDIRDAERLQGFAADWTRPAEEAAKASFRWSLVGNAVAVPVVSWLGSRLKTPGRYESSRDTAMPARRSWPRAARFDGKERKAVEIGEFPVWAEREPLEDFLRFPGTLLSARATSGFLSRAAVAKLRFPEGFLDRLRAHLSRMEAGDAVRADSIFQVTVIDRAA